MKLKSISALVFFIFLFSSCTFMKKDVDHKLFVEEYLTNYYKQKSIYRPTNLSEINYEQYEILKFIDNVETKRTKNGTFITTANMYETFINYNQCVYYSRQMIGFLWYDNKIYGNKLESILKRPIGTIKIRTDYDGEDIYIINIDNNSIIEDDIKNKNNWEKLFDINGVCK
jgi:hypothetical protein